jgi:hypothetical protein
VQRDNKERPAFDEKRGPSVQSGRLYQSKAFTIASDGDQVNQVVVAE